MQTCSTLWLFIEGEALVWASLTGCFCKLKTTMPSSRNKLVSRYSKSRSHIIYTDASLNSEHVVHLNIYQNFLLLAMKMHTYLRARGLGSRKNESFVFRLYILWNFAFWELNLIHLGTVQNLINYTFSSIKSKSLKKVAVDSDAVCSIKRTIVTWWAFTLNWYVNQKIYGRMIGSAIAHFITSYRRKRSIIPNCFHFSGSNYHGRGLDNITGDSGVWWGKAKQG